MAQVSWANAAIDDLQQLREYYDAASPKFAAKLVDQLIGRTRILANFPYSGRVVPEFESGFLREVLSGNYRIIYRLENPEKVEIARIFHAAQQINGL